VVIRCGDGEVGVIVTLTYAAAIDDPARFWSSKTMDSYFGMAPKEYQSDETDVTGRTSKIGDARMHTRCTKPRTLF
jgi:transposase